MIDRRTLLGAVACLPVACDVDARTDTIPVSDDTADIQRRIDLAAVRGGTVSLESKIYRISKTLNIHSGVNLEGKGRHYEVNARGNQFSGTWIIYEGLPEHPALRFRSVQNCCVRALGIHCGERSGTVAIEIGSDNKPATKSLIFENISVFGANIAFQWGLGNKLAKLEQCDDISFRDIGVFSCVNGFCLNSANVSDYSVISRVSFSELSGVAFDLRAPGFMTIENCAAASLDDKCIMFRIRGPSPDPLRIIGCQMEPKGYFIVADGPNDQGQIILEANVINVPVKASGILRFESRSNYINSTLHLNGFVRWRSRDDIWDGILGKPTHVPQVDAREGAQFVGSAMENAGRYTGYYLPVGFRIEKSEGRILGLVVIKAGIMCPAFTPGNQVLGSYVRPTQSNGVVYRVSRAGNAANEPVGTGSQITAGEAEFETVGVSAIFREYGLLPDRP